MTNRKNEATYESSTALSSEPSLAHLHSLVLRTHEGALNEVASRLLRRLPAIIRRRFPKASDDVISIAVGDAIMDYAQHPGRFDPARGIPLERYVGAFARRNLINEIVADKRRLRREQIYAHSQNRVALPHSGPQVELVLRKVQRLTNGDERHAATLWLSGEHRTEILACALGVAELSPIDRQREVKRFKDRFVKRIIRLAHPKTASVAPVQDVYRRSRSLLHSVE